MDKTQAWQKKSRGWRKLHIGVSNGFIVVNCLSEYRITDGEIVSNLIQSIDQDGVLAWRRTSGYYRQSEVKNMFFR